MPLTEALRPVPIKGMVIFEAQSSYIDFTDCTCIHACLCIHTHFQIVFTNKISHPTVQTMVINSQGTIQPMPPPWSLPSKDNIRRRGVVGEHQSETGLGLIHGHPKSDTPRDLESRSSLSNTSAMVLRSTGTVPPCSFLLERGIQERRARSGGTDCLAILV